MRQRIYVPKVKREAQRRLPDLSERMAELRRLMRQVRLAEARLAAQDGTIQKFDGVGQKYTGQRCMRSKWMIVNYLVAVALYLILWIAWQLT
ncbi:hypothetical protein [Bradyrhizobium sp. AUGA SZCCT0283]|uniref:hypothetical protein n=1 Tax=Bradyrhizobium sp. AUGA SZCCT0283 TaxID=2807671 RepID=UPI001BA793D9|nr:hypothetical protein [Bradyrhizobium sp. AUGA SZCCT0283]MBR1279020.1 hypothetical protein [Bradyrhizobium sp. AUGA SZCCT0283]